MVICHLLEMYAVYEVQYFLKAKTTGWLFIFFILWIHSLFYCLHFPLGKYQ